jgi:hypothetical protein
MRRPRPHRLTGSVRRLLAAAVLAGLAATIAVTLTARPVNANGLDVNLNLGPGSINLGLPLPSLLPTPTATPVPPPTPTLPGGASLPVLCPPNCTNNSQPGPQGNNGNTTPGTTTSGSSPGQSGGGSSAFGSSAGAGSATSTVSVPQSVGLAVSPPPPVEQLTPLAGISFGQAPYLWPLFILLDVAAAAAVVVLVRRTWSPTSAGD